jgi:hypothetical protein
MLLSTGMVAAAWALAITGLVLVGDAKADAAWAKTGPGTASAKADQLPVPTALTANPNCNSGNPKASFSWTAAASSALWSGYDIVAAPDAASTVLTVIQTPRQGTTASGVQLPYTPAYVSVRTVSVSGTWRGRSAGVVVC